jgi:hypothetical protein
MFIRVNTIIIEEILYRERQLFDAFYVMGYTNGNKDIKDDCDDKLKSN